MSSAIVTRLFNIVRMENTAWLGGQIDAMYPGAEIPASVFTEFQRQVMMVSLKEVYGYAVIAAVLIIIAVMASDYRHMIRSGRMLRLPQIWKAVRDQGVDASGNMD